MLFAASKRVLLVRRKHEPFQGMLSVPGGFLRPLVEDLPGCAARELLEETGLQLAPSSLIPLSVRSNPNRDTRGHVIDQSYVAILNAQQEEQALNCLQAGDDAAQVAVISLQEALRQPLAADHRQMVQEAALTMQRTRESLPARIKSWLLGITSASASLPMRRSVAAT